MHLTGKTRPYAVLGHPIGHTLSPAMHNASIEALGLDAIYLAFDVLPERLMDVLPAMRSMGFGGVNLTIPLKEVAFRNLPQLDESAKLLGAVNTVQFAPAGPIGHNTDGYGFLRAVEEAFGATVGGKSLFVLGSGGAGRAVALAAARQGAASVVLSDVDQARCEGVAAEIRKSVPGISVRVECDSAGRAKACRETDLVVQSTPVGMKAEDASPLGPESFRKGQMAFDLIYMYPQTVFMKAAASAGARTANGLGMLLHQGAQAFRIWTGIEPRVDRMREALEKVVYG